MKKLLLIALILASTLVYAKTGKLEETKTSTLEVSIVEQNSGKVLVGFDCIESEKIKVSIKDASGNIIYSSSYKNGGVKLIKFDVSALPSGEYEYEVSKGKHSISKLISKD